MTNLTDLKDSANLLLDCGHELCFDRYRLYKRIDKEGKTKPEYVILHFKRNSNIIDTETFSIGKQAIDRYFEKIKIK